MLTVPVGAMVYDSMRKKLTESSVPELVKPETEETDIQEV